MTELEKPVFDLLDLGRTRRTVAISFLVAVLLSFLFLVPELSGILESIPGLGSFLHVAIDALGLSLAFLELRHSGEANQHRDKLNQLTEEANKSHEEANRFRNETLKLQVQVFELQDSIEKKLTKVRLYARVHKQDEALKLFVSNLSDFDLWINQIELVVTEARNVDPGSRTIGGANRISRGEMEDDYNLYGALIRINRDSKDRLNMKFHVKVVAVGIVDEAETIRSPEYRLSLVNGKIIDFEVVKWDPPAD